MKAAQHISALDLYSKIGHNEKLRVVVNGPLSPVAAKFVATKISIHFSGDPYILLANDGCQLCVNYITDILEYPDMFVVVCNANGGLATSGFVEVSISRAV